MSNALNVSLQDLLYVGAVLQSRSEEIASEHKKYHQKIADSLESVTLKSRSAMENKLPYFHTMHGCIASELASHSDLLGKTVQEYQNYDNI